MERFPVIIRRDLRKFLKTKQQPQLQEESKSKPFVGQASDFMDSEESFHRFEG